MLFPTVTFAIFFLIVLPLSWALMPHRRAWQAWILLASYVFYAWWDWRFVLLLGASTVVNHVLAVAIFRTKPIRTRKTLLASAVTFDLALLGYFKYAGFFVTSAENTLSNLGLADATWIVSVTLPVGISFYTFMALSYVIDTYRGELVPASFMRFAVFQAFFPHLVAGPIVRASELLPQLESPRDPRRVDSARAFLLILSGLFLKVVIANHLATAIVDDVFAAPEAHSSLEVLVGVYAYAVQIFADFCGYTNIAIGVALAARVPVPAELCLAVHSGVAAGLLAPLAHDAVPLASRLPLHPARGQPEGPVGDVPEPDDHDAARRSLARGRVDVRRLGRHPRCRARVSSASSATAAWLGASPSRRTPPVAGGSAGSSRSTSSASRGSSSARARSNAPAR